MCDENSTNNQVDEDARVISTLFCLSPEFEEDHSGCPTLQAVFSSPQDRLAPFQSNLPSTFGPREQSALAIPDFFFRSLFEPASHAAVRMHRNSMSWVNITVTLGQGYRFHCSK